jgi:16S rRNA U516 pseudouridylate synthase RsuA-like enzyme
MLLAAGAMALLGACSRTESGDVVVKRPSDVDVKTTTDTMHMPSIGSKIDTINAPVVGTKKETLIVNKPVVGTKKKTVKVPVIKP